MDEETQEIALVEDPAPVESTPSDADQLVTEFGGVETVRDMLQQFQANARAELDEVVGRLVDNARCAFTPDELRAMPLAVLHKLDRSLRPADYSLRPVVNSHPPAAVMLYGQSWTPYEGAAVEASGK